MPPSAAIIQSHVGATLDRRFPRAEVNRWLERLVVILTQAPHYRKAQLTGRPDTMALHELRPLAKE